MRDKRYIASDSMSIFSLRFLKTLIPDYNKCGSYNYNIAKCGFYECLCDLYKTPNDDASEKLKQIAFTLGRYVARGLLSRPKLDEALLDAALFCGLPLKESQESIDDGLNKGIQDPFPLNLKPGAKERNLTDRKADDAEFWALAYFAQPESLCELADFVDAQLNESEGAASVEQVGVLLSSKLIEMGRLVRSDDGIAYLLDDHNEPQEIDKKSDGFCSAMMRIGISREERSFSALRKALLTAALKHGKPIASTPKDTSC